jgi:hypothetical protein
MVARTVSDCVSDVVMSSLKGMQRELKGTVKGGRRRVRARGNQFITNQGREWTSICTTRPKRGFPSK